MSVRLATRATAVSAVQAADLTQRYGRPVAAIPNGVEADERVDEDGARRLLDELGLRPGAFVLFAAARVDPTKGCLTLLRAVRQLDDPPPLLVVGDLHHAPGHESELRAAAADLPVTFVPRLDDKAVLLGLLRTARLFVFPSTVEAMSMMLLEALDQEASVLASDIPENTTVLPEGFPTFRAGDADDLARGLRALLESSAADRRGRADGGPRVGEGAFRVGRDRRQIRARVRRGRAGTDSDCSLNRQHFRLSPPRRIRRSWALSVPVGRRIVPRMSPGMATHRRMSHY